MINSKFSIFVIFISLIAAPFSALASFGSESKFLASDGAYQDSFGEAVAISGDIAIVGAIYDSDNGDHSGSAYIFVQDSNGNWIQEQKILPDDGTAYERFGEAVAISGDIVVIGAPYSGFNGTGYAGAAYIFVRDSNGIWSQQQKLNPSSGSDVGRFGSSVGIHNDSVIIGAPKDDVGGTDSGRAYVFARDLNDNWNQQVAFAPGDAGEFAGISVDIHNDTAVIGVYFDLSYEGSAYVYERDINGTWSSQQRISASDGSTTDFFGISVAVHGDTVAVGAYYDDDNGSNSGSAYAFVRGVNGIWTQQDKLLASDGSSAAYFGHKIAVYGENIVIGAKGDSVSGEDAGSAYVFSRDINGDWSQLQKLESTDLGSYDEYGGSVDIDADSIIIGAHGNDDNGLNSGSAYVYRWLTPVPDISVTDPIVPYSDLMVDYGSVTEFSTSSETIRVTNVGTADLTIGQVDTPSQPFSFLLENCSGLTLQPTTYCVINIVFAPDSISAFSDSFDIPSDDPDESLVTVNLMGQGVGMNVPDITVTSTAIPFTDYRIAMGNIIENEVATETITITNEGNANLDIGDIGNNDLLEAPFSLVSNQCSSQILVPGADCSFQVMFEPTFASNFSDSFDIPSDDPDESSVTISITGTGIAADDNLGGGSGGSIGWLVLLFWLLRYSPYRHQKSK